MTLQQLRRASTAALVAGALLATPAIFRTTGAAATAATDCPRPHGNVMRFAPGAGKTVALTFDDGPTTFTPQILKILREYDVRATFFATGKHVHAHPRLAGQVSAEGHLIADHTYDHSYPAQVRGGWLSAYLSHQFSRTNGEIRSVTGQQPCFFRPPGGYQTSGMVGTAASRGMSTVLWSIDTEDWKQPGHTSSAFAAGIVERAKAGIYQSHPIVLMHDGKASHEPESQVSSNRSNDVKALPAILRFYKAHGYRFVDMLGRSGLPAAPTQLSLTGGTATRTVLAGTSTTAVTGHLSAITGAVADVPVRWYSRPAGASEWKLRGQVRTDKFGNVRIFDHPTVKTHYTLEFPGTGRFKASQTTQIRSVDTYTERTSVFIDAPSEAEQGSDVVLSGSISSGGKGRADTQLTVTHTVDGQPYTAHVMTDSRGNFSYTDPAVSSSTEYVITVPATTAYREGRGEVLVSVHVTDPGPPSTS